jgi:hypothetical protein
MLEYLEDVGGEFDALFFLPMDDDDESIRIIVNKYRDAGEEVAGTTVGKWWHILLFKCNDETGAVEGLDTFDAIFSDPREYISGLIPQGWYGVVAKKTTSSNVFLDDAIDKFKSMM